MSGEKQNDGPKSGGDVNEEVVETEPSSADQSFRIELKPGGNRLVIKLTPAQYFFSS